MEEVIRSLLPIDYGTFDIDNKKLYYFIANNDKIVFTVSISSLEEIDTIAYKISELKNDIIKVNSNKNEKEICYINEDGQRVSRNSSKVTLPAFLWDLYIVGLHSLEEGDPFQVNEVEKIKRDKFIARKVIVEYKNTRDLEDKFIESIFPERIIMEKLERIEAPSINIEDLLINIDMSEIISYSEVEKVVTSNQLKEYLDQVINKYILKGE